MGRCWILLVAIGCHHASPPATRDPAAPVAVASDAAVDAADPPEPEPPVAECQFARRVQCQDGLPCPAEVPAVDPNPSFHDAPARFSAVETRKARATRPEACCYLEFVATVCD